mgnify:CR=1 FL=1
MKWLPIIIVLSVFLLDQGSKLLVVKNLTLIDHNIVDSEKYRVQVIGDYVRLKYVENKGMAFGFLSDASEVVRILVFTSLTIIAIGVVIYYFMNVQKDKILVKSSFALILGGAVGNLSDKLFGAITFHQELKLLYAKVVDFIDVGINDMRWPTFNVADIAITLGVFLLLYLILTNKEEEIFSTAKKEA